MGVKKYFTDEERIKARRAQVKLRQQTQGLPKITIRATTRQLLNQFKKDNCFHSYDKAINKLFILAGVIKPKITTPIPQLKGRHDESKK